MAELETDQDMLEFSNVFSPDDLLSPHELEKLKKIVRKAIVGILREDELRKFAIASTCSEAVTDATDKLVEKTGDDREGVLLKALTLYEVAINAAREGQRLALLGQDYRFIREIVGLEEPTLSAPQRSSVTG